MTMFDYQKNWKSPSTKLRATKSGIETATMRTSAQRKKSGNSSNIHVDFKNRIEPTDFGFQQNALVLEKL